MFSYEVIFVKGTKSKEQLILAAIRLLSVADEPIEITARQIAAEAGTNLAMINYYFKSKDELLNIAIGKIIESSAEKFRTLVENVPPREQLHQMLCSLSNMVIKYSRFTKITIPYVLLQEEIKTPFYILPILRAYFGEEKNEMECRLIAYEMISFLQLAFLRSDAVLQYVGENISQELMCDKLINLQLNLFLGDEEGK